MWNLCYDVLMNNIGINKMEKLFEENKGLQKIIDDVTINTFNLLKGRNNDFWIQRFNDFS